MTTPIGDSSFPHDVKFSAKSSADKLCSKVNTCWTSAEPQIARTFSREPDLTILDAVALTNAGSTQERAKELTQGLDLEFDSPEAALLQGDKNLAFEVTKLILMQDIGRVFECIEKYGITDKEHLFQLVMLTVAENPYYVCENIQKYGIKNEEILFKIAMAIGAQNGTLISKYIRDFGIKNQAYLVSIAMQAAVQNGAGTSLYIRNYGIKAQQDLVNIAMEVAALDGHAISQYIQNYGITDQADLITIAMCSADQDGSGTSFYIQNYGIKNELDLFKIGRQAAANNGSATFEFLLRRKKQPPYYNLSPPLITALKWECVLNMLIKNGLSNSAREFLEEKIPADQLDTVQSEKIAILEQYVKHFFEGKEVPLENVFETLRKYRNTDLAVSFTSILCEEIQSNPSHEEHYNSFIGKKTYLSLPMILIAKWATSKEEAEVIAKTLTSMRTTLKNKDTGFMQTWLQTLLRINQSSLLSPERKIKLVSQACENRDPSELQERLRLIQTLSGVDPLSLDRDFDGSDMKQVLTDLLIEQLKKDPFIGLVNIR